MQRVGVPHPVDRGQHRVAGQHPPELIDAGGQKSAAHRVEWHQPLRLTGSPETLLSQGAHLVLHPGRPYT
jgi:hypothetical protein